MKRLLLALALTAVSMPAWAFCPSPNPNLLGPPHFVDNCPLPAAGLNLMAPLASPSFAALHPGAFLFPNDNNGFAISATTDSALTPSSVGFGTLRSYNVVQSLLTIQAGTTLTNIAGYGSYIVNNADSTSGNGNGVSFYSVGIANANNASQWGVNSVLSDSLVLGAVTTGTGKVLFGAEYDFNVTSSGTTVIGSDMTGASSARPLASFAYRVRPLQVTTTPTKFPWDYGLITQDAAAVVGVQLGTSALGNSTPSQTINLRGRDVGGVIHDAQISANLNGGIVLTPTNGAVIIGGTMPTSCSGQATGTLWNSSGMVKVC